MDKIPTVLARNERLITFWRHPTLGIFALVMVGAMVVGRIKTIWGFNSAALTPKTILDYPHQNLHLTLAKGAEIGHFELGSTVVLIFPRNTVTFDCAAGANLQMGTGIGQLQ